MGVIGRDVSELTILIVKIEYFERLGEGCSYREGYIAGGKKVD